MVVSIVSGKDELVLSNSSISQINLVAVFERKIIKLRKKSYSTVWVPKVNEREDYLRFFFIKKSAEDRWKSRKMP